MPPIDEQEVDILERQGAAEEQGNVALIAGGGFQPQGTTLRSPTGSVLAITSKGERQDTKRNLERIQEETNRIEQTALQIKEQADLLSEQEARQTAIQQGRDKGGLTRDEFEALFEGDGGVVDATGVQFDPETGLFFPDKSAVARISPQAQEIVNNQTDLDREASNLVNQMNSLIEGSDAATANLLKSISGIYQGRVDDMREFNRRSLASVEQIGFRLGTAQFAPGISQGVLSAEEAAGLKRIGEIRAEEAQALAQAKIAADAQKFDQLNTLFGRIDELREEKQAQLAAQNKMAVEKANEIAEQRKVADVQSVIANVIASGVSDPVDIFNQALKLDKNVTFDDIEQAADIFLKEEDAQTATGDFGQFESALNAGAIPPDMTFFEFLEQRAIAKKVDSGTTPRREDLTAFELLAARNLSVKIFGRRAGTKVENVSLIEDLIARGMTVDEVEDQLRFSTQSEGFTGTIRNASQSVGSLIKSDAERQNFFDSLDDLLEQGQDEQLKDLLRVKAISTLGTEEARSIRGEQRAIELLDEIEGDLAAFENKGGKTNIFVGTDESVRNKIGTVKDSELAEIANKIAVAIQRYRRSISGAAFTESEAAEYKRVFPAINKTGELNLARINSLRDVLEGDVEFILGEIIGKESYEILYGRTDKDNIMIENPTATRNYLDDIGIDNLR